jgi:hypothetical protein
MALFKRLIHVARALFHVEAILYRVSDEKREGGRENAASKAKQRKR